MDCPRVRTWTERILPEPQASRRRGPYRFIASGPNLGQSINLHVAARAISFRRSKPRRPSLSANIGYYRKYEWRTKTGWYIAHAQGDLNAYFAHFSKARFRYKHILLHRYIRQWGRATSSTNIVTALPLQSFITAIYRHMIIADYREIIWILRTD